MLMRTTAPQRSGRRIKGGEESEDRQGREPVSGYLDPQGRLNPREGRSPAREPSDPGEIRPSELASTPETMLRPRIKRTAERIETPDGDVYLMRPSAGSDIRIEKPDEAQRRLLAALDGQRTTEQLEAEFGAEAVGDVLSQMQVLEVVEDAADDERVPAAEMARFDRQLRYFSDIGAGGLTPSECQDRLREARLAVIGV